MAKQNPRVTVRTYGIYSKWNGGSKELPSFQEATTQIPAVVDIEFGLVVNIVGGKNLPLEYCIDHPGIRDEAGRLRSPFTGLEYVRTNDWDFYLGDTIWEPIDDKIGPWRMTLQLQGRTVADVTFDVHRASAKPSRRRPTQHRYLLIRMPRPDAM